MNKEFFDLHAITEIQHLKRYFDRENVRPPFDLSIFFPALLTLNESQRYIIYEKDRITKYAKDFIRQHNEFYKWFDISWGDLYVSHPAIHKITGEKKVSGITLHSQIIPKDIPFSVVEEELQN